MEDSVKRLEALVQRGAGRLTGHQRRLFQAEVALALCDGSARRAERRFGWGRETVEQGLHELRTGVRCLEHFSARRRPRWEEQRPQLAQDLRALVEPRTHADPELKSERRYTNLPAREALELLQSEKGYAAADLPSERTMRKMLNRLGYRLKRIQKAKPLKKTAETDAIFANVAAARQGAGADPGTVEISMDTKAKVPEGDYCRGGKNPDGRGRNDGEGLGP
jgi:transposase